LPGGRFGRHGGSICLPRKQAIFHKADYAKPE
jgi:hypothetical protein